MLSMFNSKMMEIYVLNHPGSKSSISKMNFRIEAMLSLQKLSLEMIISVKLLKFAQ